MSACGVVTAVRPRHRESGRRGLTAGPVRGLAGVGGQEDGWSCAPSPHQHALVRAVRLLPLLLLLLVGGVKALLRGTPGLAPWPWVRGHPSGRRLPSLGCFNGFLRPCHGSCDRAVSRFHFYVTWFVRCLLPRSAIDCVYFLVHVLSLFPHSSLALVFVYVN